MDGAKILLIDDDDDFRESVRAVLEAEGYEVVEAADGRSGLKRLVDEDPDLVVLDVMLESREEGYRVSQAIRHHMDYERYRSVPIVMVSAIQETPDERFGPRGGDAVAVDRYMTKPLDVSEFMESVDRMTDRKAIR